VDYVSAACIAYLVNKVLRLTVVSILYAVVVALYMATIRVYLHNVSLMYLCVESAHGVEGGAAGQHTWHT
jgi:hypothetical protein